LPADPATSLADRALLKRLKALLLFFNEPPSEEPRFFSFTNTRVGVVLITTAVRACSFLAFLVDGGVERAYWLRSPSEGE